MSAVPAAFPFRDPELGIEARLDDLLSRLTMEEKAAQMLHEAPAIPRLGIPAYNWWNECLHGVARAGVATVFPQAIGLAATWNVPGLHRIAEVIATEARAKHHEFLRQGDHGMYKGLTFWSPNINIFRDPRWGRGHETYGEDPYLTGRLGVAFCQGLQGTDQKYLRLVATPKHFAVHSGPEGLRHSFDARVTQKDLRETYLPAFFDCVVEGKAHSAMPGYNRVNGEPCCASETLLKQILREEWGFDGYVVSDCWAIRDFHESHKVTTTPEESAAMAVKMGCDLNCGCTYEHLPKAVQTGLLSEADLDVSVRRLFRARLLLGMFDSVELVPHASVPYDVVGCAEHREVALQSARESIVLLKNAGNLLPLSRDVGTIAVIGPNANDDHVLVANYFGIPTEPVTPLEGIRRAVSKSARSKSAVSKGTRVLYTDGCKLTGMHTDGLARSGNLAEAVSVAQRADVVVLVLGLSAEIEGEQGDVGNSEAAGDKVDLNLTGLQQRMMEEIVALGKPVVLVLMAGSPLSVTWAEEHVPAIVDVWYPGETGGIALAEVLFGDYSPAGRLPITFPRSADDVPPFADYAMKGRTYRYLEKEPLYPFGYGLSYTSFAYSDLSLSATRLSPEQNLALNVTVQNTGSRDGDEVVQVYLRDVEASVAVPHHSLKGFLRVHLKAGERREVSFVLTPRDLSLIDEAGRRVLEPGRFRVSVGGSQPDARSVALMGCEPLSAEFAVQGDARTLPY